MNKKFYSAYFREKYDEKKFKVTVNESKPIQT